MQYCDHLEYFVLGVCVLYSHGSSEIVLHKQYSRSSVLISFVLHERKFMQSKIFMNHNS